MHAKETFTPQALEYNLPMKKWNTFYLCVNDEKKLEEMFEFRKWEAHSNAILQIKILLYT